MLKECIESIINLPINNDEREIILIDDGSEITPNDYLKELNKWIRYVRKENGGLSQARNEGLRIAKGKYIQFVDGDDIILKTNYEKCLDIIKAKDADMLIFKLTNNINTSSSDDVIITNGIAYIQNNNIRSSACGYIFKKSILGELSFTEGIYHEDDEFTPLLIIRANILLVTNYKAYFYRERTDSITSCVNKEKIAKRLNDKRDVIFRLQEKDIELNTNCPNALTRRVHQLTMDYIYKCLIEINERKSISNRLDELREKGLYPLPYGNYTNKYKLFKTITENKIGVFMLKYILPLIKKER